MDDLVQLVSQRTGLSEAMSRQAVNVVLDYLKERLPAPLAGQVDMLLGTDKKQDAGDVAQLLKGLGGRFGF